MNTTDKTLFLKSDKIGDGELGSILIQGFLNTMLEQKNFPKEIICVNSAVLLTTANENDTITKILLGLEQNNVKISSCGTCLDYYEKRDDLKVGTAGNAINTVDVLLNDTIVSL